MEKKGRILFIVRRADILHLLAFEKSVDFECDWAVVKTAKMGQKSFEDTCKILDFLGTKYKAVTCKEAYEAISEKTWGKYDYVALQDQWGNFQELDNIHEHVKTLFIDYVTVSNAMKSKKHDWWSLKGNNYVKNATFAFIHDLDTLEGALPNMVDSKSYKALGIDSIKGFWPNSTNKFKILIELHFTLSQSELLPIAVLHKQFDQIENFIKKNPDTDIVFNPHPNLYYRFPQVMQIAHSIFEKYTNVTFSDMPMHMLGKAADVIICDGISMLYECHLLDTPCIRIKDESYEEIFSDEYLFLVENLPTVKEFNKLQGVKYTKFSSDHSQIREYLLSGADQANTLLHLNL